MSNFIYFIFLLFLFGFPLQFGQRYKNCLVDGETAINDSSVPMFFIRTSSAHTHAHTLTKNKQQMYYHKNPEDPVGKRNRLDFFAFVSNFLTLFCFFWFLCVLPQTAQQTYIRRSIT